MNGNELGASLLAALVTQLVIGAACRAETLNDVLTDTYRGNATIQEQRFQQRQTDEQLSQAEAGWRPVVNLSGSATRGQQYLGFPLPGPKTSWLTLRTGELTITQPVIRWGGVDASIDQANASIAAGAAQLDSTQQQQLLAAASAYLDVYRDKIELDLANNLVEVLKLNQHDVQVTFQAGAATETDTSQAAARLEGAVAGRYAAEAALQTSLARFQDVVGRPAGDLARPDVIGTVPASEDDAFALAVGNNPAAIAARQQHEAAQHQVEILRADLFPKVDAIGELIHQDDDLFRGVKLNQAQFGVQASVPLYAGGANYSQIRAAKEAVSVSDKAVLAVERQIHESVTTAWNALNAARAQAGQYRAQITANDIALNDTRKEVSVGTRTRLDTLNAEQELFGSRVNLVSAEHDILLATFQLEVAAGTFTPSKLSLGVPDYDPSKHRDDVSGKWWGTTPPTE